MMGEAKIKSTPPSSDPKLQVLPPPSPQPPRAPLWRVYLRAVAVLTVTWLIPGSWLALSPPLAKPLNPAQTTRESLTAINQAVVRFRETYKMVPADFAMLRAFAHIEKLPLPAYDPFGYRFQYQRLGERYFLLRSFGADGIQNTPTSPPDMGIARWGNRPEKSPRYVATAAPEFGLYPAVLLGGTDSPDRQWLGRLFVDVENGTRTLAVRHRTQAGLFMSCPHDLVEEFLWLPDGKRLIYTATGSSRYRDGLYLWDLERDTHTNLLDLVERNATMAPAGRSDSYFLTLSSLATIKAAPKAPGENATSSQSGSERVVLTAFFSYRSDAPLNPVDLFRPQSVLAFELNPPATRPQDPPSARYLGQNFAELAHFTSPLSKFYAPSAQLDTEGGSIAQRNFLKLPVQGDAEKVLLEWHELIDRQSESPSLPYALWVLASLYGEAHASFAQRHDKDSEILRTYGTEVARALINYPMAPTYLRAMGSHLYESLLEGATLPYRFGRLVPPSAALELDKRNESSKSP